MPCWPTLRRRSPPGWRPRTRMRRFAADASHELRTPLVTIRGFSELYRHGALSTPEDVATAMGRIESEAKRMGAMVEDLLLLARIDEQRPLQQKPVDLLLLAHDAVVDTQASDRSRAITLTGLDGGPGTPAPVLGDEAKLRQVVGNLVGNALRYTPEGTPIELAVGRPDRRRTEHGSPSSRSATTAPAFRRRKPPGSSSASTGRTPPGPGRPAAAGWAWRSWPPSSARIPGPCGSAETDGGGATLVVSLPFLDEDATRTVHERTCPHRCRRRCPAGALPAYARGVRKDPDEAGPLLHRPHRRLAADSPRPLTFSRAPPGRGCLPTISRGTPMSIISVDTELLQLKSANVQATVERISADVQAMKRGLDELRPAGAAPPPPTSRPWSRSGR